MDNSEKNSRKIPSVANGFVRHILACLFTWEPTQWLARGEWVMNRELIPYEEYKQDMLRNLQRRIMIRKNGLKLPEMLE